MAWVDFRRHRRCDGAWQRLERIHRLTAERRQNARGGTWSKLCEVRRGGLSAQLRLALWPHLRSDGRLPEAVNNAFSRSGVYMEARKKIPGRDDVDETAVMAIRNEHSLLCGVRLSPRETLLTVSNSRKTYGSGDETSSAVSRGSTIAELHGEGFAEAF